MAPGRVTLVDVGVSRGLDVVFGLLADAVRLGREVAVVDGGNAMDVYRLGAAARRRGVPREAVFDGVRVARGFTAHQLQALVEDHLEGVVGAATGLLVAFDLPCLYQDEDLDRAEACALLERALDRLRATAEALEVPAVVTNASLADGRLRLRRVLDDAVDEVVRLHDAPQGGLRVSLPRRGATVLAPAPGARQLPLDAFLDAPLPVHDGGALPQRVPVDPHLVRGGRRRQEVRAVTAREVAA